MFALPPEYKPPAEYGKQSTTKLKHLKNNFIVVHSKSMHPP